MTAVRRSTAKLVTAFGREWWCIWYRYARAQQASACRAMTFRAMRGWAWAADVKHAPGSIERSLLVAVPVTSSNYTAWANHLRLTYGVVLPRPRCGVVYLPEAIPPTSNQEDAPESAID